MNNVSGCPPNARIHMSGHQRENMWAAPLFTNSSDLLIYCLPLPALGSSVGVKTLLWSVTGHFKVTRKQEQRRELLYWLGWLILNTKWGEGEILWGTCFYSYLLGYDLMGNHIKYLKQKKIYLLLRHFWKETLGHPASKYLWPTNRSASLGQSEYELGGWRSNL